MLRDNDVPQGETLSILAGPLIPIFVWIACLLWGAGWMVGLV